MFHVIMEHSETQVQIIRSFLALALQSWENSNFCLCYLNYSIVARSKETQVHIFFRYLEITFFFHNGINIATK